MRDRTGEQLRTQLGAMACERYELGIRDGRADRMVIKAKDAAAIPGSMSWLKHKNAGGYDVFIRPLGSVGLVLIDDLKPPTLADLDSEGLNPAVVVETSPGNLQAWIRLAAAPIPPELASAAARKLAQVYGGDPAAASWRQFGRLAGYTNRKPQHKQANGRYPFVLLRQTYHGVAPAGPELLAELAVEPEHAAIADTAAPHFSPGPRAPVCALAEQYRKAVAEHCQHYTVEDWSRLDWMVTRELAAAHPDATIDDLATAIRRASPHVEERKMGHVGGYAELTARKAVESLRGRARSTDLGASGAEHGTLGAGEASGSDLGASGPT